MWIAYYIMEDEAQAAAQGGPSSIRPQDPAAAADALATLMGARNG